jgi:hypothetical protein
MLEFRNRLQRRDRAGFPPASVVAGCAATIGDAKSTLAPRRGGKQAEKSEYPTFNISYPISTKLEPGPLGPGGGGGAGALPVQGVTVRNGSLRGFSYGIQAKFSQGGRFENLSICSNLNFGLCLDGSSGRCNGNRIAHCAISGNADDGILFYAESSGQCSGNVVSDCAIQGNGDLGIRAVFRIP